MKKDVSKLAMLGMVLAFGLVLMGCPPEVPDPPSISISGTPKVGETLTANITDSGGNFQDTLWYAYDNPACTGEGALIHTGQSYVSTSTYVIEAYLVGTYIRVSVDWQENTAEPERTYYSNIVGPVAAADLAPLTDVTLTPATASVSKGNTQAFTLKFKQGSSFNSSNITWSIVGANAVGTTITGSGVSMDGTYTVQNRTLTVSSGETATTLTVKVVYGTQEWTATVTVN